MLCEIHVEELFGLHQRYKLLKRPLHLHKGTRVICTKKGEDGALTLAELGTARFLGKVKLAKDHPDKLNTLQGESVFVQPWNKTKDVAEEERIGVCFFFFFFHDCV